MTQHHLFPPIFRTFPSSSLIFPLFPTPEPLPSVSNPSKYSHPSPHNSSSSYPLQNRNPWSPFAPPLPDTGALYTGDGSCGVGE